MAQASALAVISRFGVGKYKPTMPSSGKKEVTSNTKRTLTDEERRVLFGRAAETAA